MITKRQHNIGRLLMVTTALLWGLAGVCVKSITWNSMSLMSMRSLISLIMVLAVRRSFKISFTKTNVLGALMISITSILYVLSIKLTTAGTAIVLQYIAPILVFLYSVVFQKKKARLSEALITFAVFVGCVLSFADNLDPTRIVGNLLGLLSGFTFAGQIIITNSEGSDSESSMIMGNAIGFLVCLPFMFFDKGLSFDAKNVIWVLVLGVFQYGLANVLFSKGIKLVDKIEGSLILTIEPIFNPIPVAIFCGEKMGTLAIIGFAVVIIFVTAYGLLPQEQKEN
ncbi:MAG: DMT family transporter [Clostridia bacterium]|nr:DMT family transporter [Clostridia bacterium]